VDDAIHDPFTVVLSQKTARKYFGDVNPVGRTVRYMGNYDFRVIAVMQDMPQNSHFVMNLVFPLEAYQKINQYDLSDWRKSSCYTYLLLSEPADPVNLQGKLPALVKKYDTSARSQKHTHHSSLFLQPLLRIHLYSQLSGELAANNDIKNIYLFVSIALLILIIACFNYMNLATVHALKRTKEVGIRKTVGAKKGQITFQFLSESFLLTLIACLLSIMAVELALPSFNAFVERELHLSLILNANFLLWLCGLIMIVGFLSGSYPAFFISAFKPLSIFDTLNTKKRGKMSLRNGFVLLQFAISIVLIISTFVVKGQLNFIFTRDVGYQKDQIVTLKIKGEEERKNLDILKTELTEHPDILMASSSTYLPNRISDQTDFNWPGKPEDIEVRCYVSSVDYDYVNLYRIKIIEGRNFSRDFPSDAGGAFLINETALKALGWEDPLAHELIHWSGTTGKVVGVVKDFNYHSLHRKIEPLYLYFEPTVRNYYLSLKISGYNIPETIDFIKKKVETFSPNYPFEYNFFDTIFDEAYKKERRLESLFSVFALIAILVSCLGLFGLAAYNTEKRTKEIGIRKVLGASVPGIVVLLSKEFLKWVIVANIIAWPIAWYGMNNWLQNFAYRIDVGVWTFVLSAMLALVIALLTVSYQAVKAAIANPVDSLRYE
jgi:putative ABC transport system permease protein